MGLGAGPGPPDLLAVLGPWVALDAGAWGLALVLVGLLLLLAGRDRRRPRRPGDGP
jgi:hypothetical protein